MSSNFTFQNYTPQWSNYSSPFKEIFRRFYITTIAVDTTFAVAGTLVNLWFLAALLLSPEIRSRMRNKIICGMLVVNLTEALILCPLSIVREAALLLDSYASLNCYIETIHNNIYHIQDFVGNWYLLILVCVYTAQVMNIEPKVTPLWKKILTIVIFLSPCIISVLIVPATMNTYYKSISDDHCWITTYQSIKVYKSLDTALPQALASLFLAVTLVLKCRRYPQGRSSDTLRAQLIDDGPQIDPAYPFVAILVTAVLSDFCLMVAFMNPIPFIKLGFETWLYVYVAFGILTYLRLILVPVMLLLFRDIREQIKTWRPWRRSARSADLVVAYVKNAS